MNDLASPVSRTDDLPCFDGPQAWRGADLMARPEEWTHVWSGDEIAEIGDAAARLEAEGREIMDIGAADFPLPTVAPLLARVRKDLLRGRSFVLLRGLPVEQWSFRRAAIAFWGIGRHLGEPCSQNGKGHVLGHVRDLGLDYADPKVRGYQTSARLPYHTDFSDLVGLMCWRRSRTGGLSSIVSSTTLWNEIATRRPDLARVLVRPFHRTRWGEIPEGEGPTAQVPVFMPCDGRMIAQYVRSAIRKAQGEAGVPPLSPEQVEALDFLDGLAADPDFHLDMDLEPGDVQIVCNHFIMHSRTAYEDWPEPERRRHMLRLWLACDDGPVLPHWMTSAHGEATESGRPNGIRVPGVPLVAPLAAT